MKHAESYARALFEESGHSFQDEIKTVLDLQNQDLNFKRAIQTNLLSYSEREELAKKVFEKFNFSNLFFRFLVLLAKKGRFAYLGAIGESLRKLEASSKNTLIGEVFSTAKLHANEIEALQAKFEKEIGKKVILENRIDPKLTLGVVVAVGSKRYEVSVQSQIQQFLKL